LQPDGLYVVPDAEVFITAVRNFVLLDTRKNNDVVAEVFEDQLEKLQVGVLI
jgi:hypothetical protein